MTINDLQDAFDTLEGVNAQGWFIDRNLEHASDTALANELHERGFRIIAPPPEW